MNYNKLTQLEYKCPDHKFNVNIAKKKRVCTTCLGCQRPMSSRCPYAKAKTYIEIVIKIIYILYRFGKCQYNLSGTRRPYHLN